MAVERQCEWCGKKFYVRPSVVKKGGGKFCSQPCVGKWRSKNMRGENAPNWAGGCIVVECQQCKKEFKTYAHRLKSGRGKFCSRKCRSQWISQNLGGENNPLWKQVQTVCLYCEKEFFAQPGILSDGKGKFCSRTCRGKWQSENLRGAKAPRWAGGKIKKPCLQCGKIFETWPFKIRNGEGKFCSLSCRSQWSSENTSGEKSWHWTRAIVQCKQCGKDFSAEPALLKRERGQFCSRRCKDLWWSKNSCGEDHWNWQGGKSLEPYGIEWTEDLRESIRKRDNYTCAISGKVWQPGQKKFSVHHIDYDKTNNDPHNLITLSKSSHVRTNSNRYYWQALLAPIAKSTEMRANAFVNGI